LHGLPRPAVDRPAAPHSTIELTKTPLSLPPIVMVTSWVVRRSAASWGGTPSYWGSKKSPVSAAPQVTSVSRAPTAAARTCGLLRTDRRHGGGACGSGGSTPEAAL
jgi:hypothetical protein